MSNCDTPPNNSVSLSAQDGEAETGSPEKFTQYIQAEIKKMAKAVKDSGAQVE